MHKNADAFRTISEVADDLSLPQHVLRFWETRFPQIRPLKRAGGRRYYRPNDISLLRAIRQLLYDDGYTIKGVQKLLKEQGAKAIGTEAANIAHQASLADPHSEAVDESATTYEDDLDRGLDATPIATHTALEDSDRAELERALATIEDCKRILDALR